MYRVIFLLWRHTTNLAHKQPLCDRYATVAIIHSKSAGSRPWPDQMTFQSFSHMNGAYHSAGNPPLCASACPYTVHQPATSMFHRPSRRCTWISRQTYLMSAKWMELTVLLGILLSVPPISPTFCTGQPCLPGSPDAKLAGTMGWRCGWLAQSVGAIGSTKWRFSGRMISSFAPGEGIFAVQFLQQALNDLHSLLWKNKRYRVKSLQLFHMLPDIHLTGGSNQSQHSD